MLATIGENHHLVVALTLLKLEGAEVYPRATTHLLIHPEACGATSMYHKVFGIGHARRMSLIGDIHSILSALRNSGNPQCSPFGATLAPCGAKCATSTLTERIIPMQQQALGDGKPHSSILPLCIVAILFNI